VAGMIRVTLVRGTVAAIMAGMMLNVTNFSKGKTIEGKTIKKFSNCLSLF
jgi:hypothetical protein